VTADFDTIRAGLLLSKPYWIDETPELAALARVQAAAEQAEKILPADEVCGCLDETGGRQVRIFERCERCHALMESDLPEQLAEQSESADEWREQWERAEQRGEVAERARKDARMKERALTDYFADASRRADEWQQRSERAERERDEARVASLQNISDWNVDLMARLQAEARVAALTEALTEALASHGGDGPHVTGRIAFAIEVEEDDIDGGYSARCLDLPGCRSDGDTEEEAVNNLIEAIAGVVEARMQRKDTA